MIPVHDPNADGQRHNLPPNWWGWLAHNPARISDLGHFFGSDRFGKLYHVLVLENGTPQYDTLLRAERGGVAFVAPRRNEEMGRRVEIGMARYYRFVLKPKDEPRWLEAWPNVSPLIKELGRPSLEIPRGGIERSDKTTLLASIREFEDETGYTVRTRKRLGRTCDNTSWSPHLITIYCGLTEPTTEPAKSSDHFVEPLEWCDLKQIARLIRNETIFDQFTLSALQLLWARGMTDRELPSLH